LIPNSHGREPGGQQSGGSAVFGRGLPAADHLIDRVSAQLRGNARRRLAIAASRIRDSAPPRRRRSGSSDAQALDRLARDAGNQVEVLVQMQHGEPGQRGRGGDDQVRYRRGAVLAAIGEDSLDFDRPVLDQLGQVLHGIADSGDCRSPARNSGPDRAENPISGLVTVVMRPTRARSARPTGLAARRDKIGARDRRQWLLIGSR
jgi:hypothetical protein